MLCRVSVMCAVTEDYIRGLGHLATEDDGCAPQHGAGCTWLAGTLWAPGLSLRDAGEAAAPRRQRGSEGRWEATVGITAGALTGGAAPCSVRMVEVQLCRRPQ